jgi:hypothetical protein
MSIQVVAIVKFGLDLFTMGDQCGGLRIII